MAGHPFPLAHLLAPLVTALLAVMPAGLQARTLMVGAGQDYARPSDAARAAAAGDQIRILHGAYYDCAVWTADGLVIEGAGPGTVLTDTACEGKASFVITGRGVTVRDLTFARIRVPDGNGAGIRAEGQDLLVERVRFENNQEGLLAAAAPGSVLRIIDCTFAANGAGPQSAALVAGPIGRLLVRDTSFEGGQAGAAVVSHADATEIQGSRIAAAEAARGASVQVSGGLLIEDTALQAGRAGGRAAVLALPAAADAPLTLRGNTLTGGGVLLLNWSGRLAMLTANTLGPDGIEQSTAGAWSYRARAAARTAYAALRGMAHRVLSLLR